MGVLKENKPTADILMTSMRAMGYSFESAVADIIDNSISAHANEIVIRFPENPSERFVAICDNGDGMTQHELFDAMKYGSEGKRGGRSEDDLGRFGLGLKAASLSQCRKLTVVSKKNGVYSAYIWDLDIIIEKKDWFVVECSDDQIRDIHCSDFLDEYPSGTVVIWENFDFIEKSSGDLYAVLNEKMSVTADYLSLIFHRFLNRTDKSSINIMINNYQLKGLDPFLESHNKTNIRRKISIPIADNEGKEHMVTVQPYILPFQKDLSAADKKLSGGIENYRSAQGFYIYRNERLIVWGKWFNRPRDELTKYARIKVDIPNALDDIWGIDIKKQSATIPASVRKRLNKAVDEVMDISVRKQSYRGRTDNPDDSVEYIWERISQRQGMYTYRINRSSSVFRLIEDEISDTARAHLEMILEEIENNVPYQQIYIDKSQNVIDENQDDGRIADLEEKAEAMISIMLKSGSISREEAVAKLLTVEPFCNYPDLRERLIGGGTHGGV